MSPLNLNDGYRPVQNFSRHANGYNNQVDEGLLAGKTLGKLWEEARRESTPEYCGKEAEEEEDGDVDVDVDMSGIVIEEVGDDYVGMGAVVIEGELEEYDDE